MTNGVALLCHPYHRGGVTQWMIQAGAEWRRRGHQVWFVTVRPKGQFRSGGNRPAMADLLDQLPTPERPAIAARDAGSEFEYGTEAYRAGVYAQLLRASVPAGIPVIVSDDRAVWRGGAALATRNPLIGVLHSDDAPYYELARRYGHVTATLVCVSRRVESEARRQVPSLSDRLAVIPCGIPMSRPNHRSAPLTDRLRLIWAGRIEQHQKRVLDIPRIAAGLRAQGLPFHWDIIGDGPERQALQDAVKASGLDDHVRMLGWRPSEEVRELAARADVLVLPSNFEGMPMVLMEVMAEGCAAVASRVSGVEDYESHALAAGCLWVFGVGEVDQAVRGVMLASRVPAAQRARLSRALAEEEFSITRCVDRYEKVIQRARSSWVSVDERAQGGNRVAALVSRPLSVLRVARLRMRINGG